MNCQHCAKHIPTENNIMPLFCPHCMKPVKATPVKELTLFPEKEKQHKTTTSSSQKVTLPTTHQGMIPVKKDMPPPPDSFPESLPELEDLAKRQPYALLELAQRHLFGIGVKPNPRYSYDLLQNESLTNYPTRYFLLGQLHHHYSYEPNSISHAIEYYNLAYQLGCPFSAVELAIYDMDHNNPPKQGDLVFSQLSQGLPNQENRIAYYLGNCYLYGYGTKEDLTQAEYYLKLSYQNNDPKGYVGYARYLLKTGNALEAHEILDQGVENKMPQSLVYLANCYLFAMGVPEDPLFALELLQKSDGLSTLLSRRATEKEKQDLAKELTTYANQSTSTEISQLKKILFPNLQLYYYAKALIREKNIQELKAILDQFLSPEPNHLPQGTLHPATIPSFYECMGANPPPQVYHLLGTLYEIGEILPHSQEKAIYFYQKSASYNYGPSLHTLGRYHEEGTFFSQNLEKAFHYYKTASDQGDPASSYRLGQCLHEGLGVSQDKSLAEKYFIIAEQQGYPVPQDFLPKQKTALK